MAENLRLPKHRLNYLPSKKADIPVYSFEKHARLDRTTTVYSPHVLILEGIFALHDERVLDMLDLKVGLQLRIGWHEAEIMTQIFCEADADLCLSRRCKACMHFFLAAVELTFGIKWYEMSGIVGETSKDVSSSGSPSSSPTSTNSSSRNEWWAVRTSSFLRFSTRVVTLL